MRLALATTTVVLCGAVLSAALAQHKPACEFLRSNAAGYLKQCGDKLYSWSLQSSDVRWRAGMDHHGRFTFECLETHPAGSPGRTILDILRAKELEATEPPKCLDQPGIGGFLFDPSEWNGSPRDPSAILSILIKHHVPDFGPDDLLRRSRPVCEVFDVAFSGMAGHAACFSYENGAEYIVAMVAVDDETGILLAFVRQGLSPDDLKRNFLNIVAKLNVERASGDAALLRWFR